MAFVFTPEETSTPEGLKRRRRYAEALLQQGTDASPVKHWTQALARVLLRGTANGVGASYLNQAVEVAELRSVLAATLGTVFVPQLVLRMGLLPPEVQRPTPRRPVEDVLTGPSHLPGAIH